MKLLLAALIFSPLTFANNPACNDVDKIAMFKDVKQTEIDDQRLYLERIADIPQDIVKCIFPALKIEYIHFLGPLENMEFDNKDQSLSLYKRVKYSLNGYSLIKSKLMYPAQAVIAIDNQVIEDVKAISVFFKDNESTSHEMIESGFLKNPN